MYEFLSIVGDQELRDLLEREAGPNVAEHAAITGRPGLIAVLAAKYGYDALASPRVRRMLLESLEWGAVAELSARCGVDPAGKVYDVALRLSELPWRPNASLVQELAERLCIPDEYLPELSARPSAVELIVPRRPIGALFDFQEEIVSQVVAVLSGDGGRRCMVQLPTGAGKTRTAIESVLRWDYETRGLDDGCVVWLAHTRELCEQACDTWQRVWADHGRVALSLRRMWGGLSPPVFAGPRTVVVASIARLTSLRRLAPERFAGMKRSVCLVVFDEAHRALGDVTKRMLKDLLADDVRLLGLSATPGRGTHDERGNRILAATFGGQLIGAPSLGNNPIQVLQQRGVLSKLEFISAESGVEVAEREVSTDEESESDVDPRLLRRLASSRARNKLILDAVSDEVHEGRQVIVFACSVSHARQLAFELAATGAAVGYVDCELTPSQRTRVVEAFRGGLLRVLFNYGVLATGFDAPGVETVVIARPTTSIVLYAQMVGRGLRGPAVGGTTSCRVLHIHDALAENSSLDDVYRYFGSYWSDGNSRK
ncbi:MAG: DEAD/DEAH box helicase family protein [Planctomycetota bacterium]|nr:DEAD/DEAH box helicase family protein [Planctomycetota bacterium]